ncbi:MAG: 2-C-methyl-D-erythritol 4-phosphate cytidylyltransferase [Firmicutes bacterium]|nr:2-C-methyl-D-erythritol 4-phosphate cytidylyltransferase [Bacillota bacterium]
MSQVGVVLAAAGSGRRMGKQENKVLLDLLGIPVIIRSLRKFEGLDWVKEIVVVCRQEDCQQIELLIKEWQIAKVKGLVIGGATRQASVFNGLKALSADCDFVFIHDAARPLVEEQTLQTIYQSLHTNRAVGVAVPVKDTIKQVDQNLLVCGTPDRSQLWAIQTPQAFTYQLIVDAYEQAEKQGWQVTDDCGLVEKLGLPVKIIPGTYANIKLTTPEDLLFATAILENQEES